MIERQNGNHLEEEMQHAVMERISVPEKLGDIPRIVVVVGPCRTATGALATALSNSEDSPYGAHQQPIKTIRRDIFGVGTTGGKTQYERGELEITPGNHTEIVKETLGPASDAEFFNPLDVLLKKGVPRQNLALVTTFRDPLETYDSQVTMWGNERVLPAGFNKQYLATEQIFIWARMNGIPSAVFINESLQGNAYDTIRMIANTIGLSYSDSMVDWEEGRSYERTITYEIPPTRFIQGAISKVKGGRGGLLWKPHTMQMSEKEKNAILPFINPANDVYNRIENQMRT